tara:strand:+ start:724 stop:1173 length:450 start_codon:yes stop_codon:yes gene_type:complete
MVDFLTLIENTPTWVFLTAGLAFILTDLFIINTSYFLVIGLSIMMVGGLSFLKYSGLFQLASFPIFLILNLLLIRKFFIDFSSNNELGTDGVIGGTGTIIYVDESNDCRGRAAITGFGEWEVKNMDNKKLNINAEIKVVKREGLTLLVI